MSHFRCGRQDFQLSFFNYLFGEFCFGDFCLEVIVWELVSKYKARSTKLEVQSGHCTYLFSYLRS